jgi:hypothetical protein
MLTDCYTCVKHVDQVVDAHKQRRGSVADIITEFHVHDPLYFEVEWLTASCLLKQADGLWSLAS